MTPKQIELVQQSWAQVAPISDQAAELFYGRLFETAPQVRSMFKAPIENQGKKLMQTLGVVVGGLTRLDDLLPTVQGLGVRHGVYGVRPADYDLVAAALLWTLEQGLGEGFTDEVREAWTAAYQTLAGVMIEAAEGAALTA